MKSRHKYWTFRADDPDETEGRRLYRIMAERDARVRLGFIKITYKKTA